MQKALGLRANEANQAWRCKDSWAVWGFCVKCSSREVLELHMNEMNEIDEIDETDEMEMLQRRVFWVSPPQPQAF